MSAMLRIMLSLTLLLLAQGTNLSNSVKIKSFIFKYEKKWFASLIGLFGYKIHDTYIQFFLYS